MSHRLACVPLLQEPSTSQTSISSCGYSSCVGEVTFSSSTQRSGVGLQSLIQWAPKFVSLRVFTITSPQGSMFSGFNSADLGTVINCKQEKRILLESLLAIETRL